MAIQEHCASFSMALAIQLALFLKPLTSSSGPFQSRYHHGGRGVRMTGCYKVQIRRFRTLYHHCMKEAQIQLPEVTRHNYIMRAHLIYQDTTEIRSIDHCSSSSRLLSFVDCDPTSQFLCSLKLCRISFPPLLAQNTSPLSHALPNVQHASSICKGYPIYPKRQKRSR